MAKKLRLMNCPGCGASVDLDAMRDNVMRCPYCGQSLRMEEDEETEERLDRIEERLDARERVNRGLGITHICTKTMGDKGAMKVVVESLAKGMYVSGTVFEGFEIEVRRREWIAVQMFEISWTANWNALYTKQVSHQVQHYNYKGEPDGTRTEWETLSRNGSGSTSGRTEVVLRGYVGDGRDEALERMVGFAYSTFEDPKAFPHDFAEAVSEGWGERRPNVTAQELWERHEYDAEKKAERDIREEVRDAADRMSGNWSTSKTDYTWFYDHRYLGCAMVPVMLIGYRSNGKEYEAMVNASTGDFKYVKDRYPKDQAMESKTKQKEHDVMKLGKKNSNREVFVVLSAVTNVVLIGAAFVLNIPYLILAVAVPMFLGWKLLRKMGQAKQDMLDMQYESGHLLWEQKKRRADTAKRFSVEIEVGSEPQEMKAKSNGDKVWAIVWLVVFVGVFVFALLI